MRKVLVVEDNVSHSQAMTRTLGALGLEADHADNGADGIRMLESGGYALVVSDLLMPKCTGFELFAWLEERMSNVPLVVCSAYVTDATRRLLRRYRPLEIVCKPYKEETLARAVRTLLGISRSDPV